ncbi:unnamed protein product [Ambrosiozyma monospora]|uniref:Unnamed protein product n=1 Tax=Ambrosiozyma monospora TaxID=43982 RepID=A0A9W7DDA4_AMBMO|nr:unnamed protein product [Ambrosiozyma monospora]
MLKRLYDCSDGTEELKNPLSVIATAFFFQFDDIKDSILFNYQFKRLTTRLAVSTLKMLHEREYGELFGIKLGNKCKEFLNSNGWQSGNEEWNDLPASLILEIVNSDQFFVPTEFDRIVFAIRLLQNSNSSAGKIESVARKFKSKFSFFTLTYTQQLYLLELKLRSGEPIFDSSMVNDSNMLSAHIQNSTFFDKYSPISTEEGNIPVGATFHQYSYPIKISGFSFNNRRYSYGKTAIPPFRFSIALNTATKRLTKKKIYYRGFSYCGRVWRVSISNFKKLKDDSLKIAIHRIPLSYKRQENIKNESFESSHLFAIQNSPISYTYQDDGKNECIAVPLVREELKDCQMPELLPSSESFQVGPSFCDLRENVSMYYKISLRSADNLEDLSINETAVFELENSSTNITMDHVFLPLHDSFGARSDHPLILNVMIGVI